MFTIIVILAYISDLISNEKESIESFPYAVILVLCDMITVSATIYFWELLK